MVWIRNLCIVLLTYAWVIPASEGGLLRYLNNWTAPDSISEAGQIQSEQLHRRLKEEECISLLQPHIQKVALLFLVRGEMYHEDVWTEWIGSLADLVPPSILCDDALNKCYRTLPQYSIPPKSVYDRQTYYSIFVHTKPDFPGYSSGSIFDARIVDERVETAWGSHSLLTATRVLMRAALADPFNQRFQMVCEATIPVRAPLFTHDQLLAHNMSRIGSPHMVWGDAEKSAERWPLAMHEEFPALKLHNTFHSQWVTLIRAHVHIVVDDTFLEDLYQRHCFIGAERHRSTCVSDEQYIGTLLNWKLGDRGPYEYSDDLAMARVAAGSGVPPEHIDTELIVQIRGAAEEIRRVPSFKNLHGQCRAMEKPRIQHSDFELGKESLECARNPQLQDPPPYGGIPQYPHCPFFARKFMAATAPAVKKLLQDLFIV